MQISYKYVVVEKYTEPKQDGFQVVEVTDNFVYKGQITHIPTAPAYVSDTQLKINDIILFAKYSPDTVEVDIKDKKVKFVRIEDILAIL